MDAINKQKRTTLRSQTTKLIKRIENTLVESEITEDQLDELFAELELKEKELKNLDLEIQQTIKLEEVETEIIKCDEYNSNIAIFKSKIKRRKMKLESNSNINVSSSNIRSEDSPRIINRIDQSYINLPRLTIEKFNGDPSDYQRFWDQFDSAIHKNDEISNVDKFNYLKSYLIGAAADAIKGFSLTNNNYNAAIETLKERFGKKTLVINSHLNRLLNLPPVKKSTDIFSLRKLFDTCQTEIRNLEALGIKEENYGALLCPVLIRLLPSDIVLEITRKYSTDEEWKVSEMMEILKAEIVSREKATVLLSTMQQVECISSGNKRENHEAASKLNKIRQPTASGLFNESSRKRTFCIFCESDKHYLQDCKQFKNKQIDEKRDFLMKRGNCFVCFSRGHVANKCRSSIRCRICSRRHYEIMCRENNPDKSTENENIALSNKTCNRDVLMQTLTVRLINKNKEQIIRVLIDTGSQKSYLRKETINKIGYTPTGKEKLTHSLFGGLQKTHDHYRYRIYLTDLNKNYSCNFEVLDQEKICAEVPKIKDGPWIKEARRKGIKFSDYENMSRFRNHNKDKEIDLLIGADVCGKLFTGKIKELSSGLVAMETHLGWTVMGKTDEFTSSDSTNIVLSLHVSEAQLSDLWKLDTLGILDPAESKRKDDLNKETLDLFNSTVKRDSSGRYIVSLPWLQDHPTIPSNRKLAEKRLLFTVKSLKASGNLVSYQNVFKDWLNEGIIEKIPDSGDNGHFLPHRAVIRQHATTPVRPVFDASAKEKFSYSLNDCLAKGPNLIELIPAILHRFRMGKIGISADIKKAFCQIRLNNHDQNFVKFLWFEDGDCDKLQIYQHCRVVFGINASPFLLAATLNHLFENIDETYRIIADKLKISFYVDNCLSSVENTEELREFIKTSREILASAQFDLRGWQYTENDENILEEDFLNEMNIESEEKSDVVVLGLIWNKNDDTIKLMNSSDREESKIITKRSILSAINKIFDPIGYTSPATLMPKLILQKCWKEKFNWDSPLTENIIKSFKKWEEQLDILRNIKIPRRISEFDLKDNEKHLHVFCDSSKVAYATCIFLRVQNGEKVSCQLIQAKTRLAPLKEVTIPRLELLACLIGARLANTIIDEIKIENIKIFYWTDAKNALYWIKNDGGWATFVQNRVTEIRKLSNVNNWHHVPGHLNPADLPSRGCLPESLKKSQWWNGPDWLKKMPEYWPKSDVPPDDEVIHSEKRKTVATTLNVLSQEFDFYENCSSYNKMLRTTAWMLRFKENAKKPKEDRVKTNLTVEDLDKAELVILKYVQRIDTDLKGNLSTFRTFVDEKGIIRVQTRISMRKDLEDFRYPIVLPANHNVTHRIIERKHIEMNHAGVQILLSTIREKYWIIRSRKTIRKVLLKCLKCQRFLAQAAQVPISPLPEDRIRDASVFEITGTDLFGPLFLKDGQKCWVVLFTCAVFRAVHLELTSSLTTDNFIQCLRRFISRRGRPHIIYSDNGTNLVSTRKELNSVDWTQIEEYTTKNRIIWKLNPPASPWWGGFWERLIRIIKSILKRILGNAHLDYEELYTIICDTERTVNSRPLTYISDDPEDLTPLTPEMFLKDIRESGVPDLDSIERNKLKKRFAYRQKLKDDLRKRFRNEYLGSLREFNNIKRSSKIKIGDLVLIRDDNLKPIQWPMAKVINLYPGRDGEVRVARVKTKNGEFIRPLQRLSLLEVSDEETPNLQEQYSRTGRKIKPVQRLLM